MEKSSQYYIVKNGMTHLVIEFQLYRMRETHNCIEIAARIWSGGNEHFSKFLLFPIC